MYKCQLEMELAICETLKYKKKISVVMIYNTNNILPNSYCYSITVRFHHNKTSLFFNRDNLCQEHTQP